LLRTPGGTTMGSCRPRFRSARASLRRTQNLTAVWRGADGQVPGPSVTGDVDRLSTEQRADTVKQGQSEESTPVLERGHHRCGQAVSERSLGDRRGQSSVGDSEFDNVHAGEGRAPSDDLTSVDVGLFTCPADDGAV